MIIEIEIPEAFEREFNRDRFKESLERIMADIEYQSDIGVSLMSGNYEFETVEMLENALNRCKVIKEDYKHIKQWKEDIMASFCKYDVSSFEELVDNVRNKTVDDFVNLSKEYTFKYHKEDISSCCIGFIEFLAEQLKAGVKNG